MITLFKGCGHMGMMAEGKTVKAFIRVAETRGRKVEESPKQCPDCRKAGERE
jgi:hypothetical protein